MTIVSNKEFIINQKRYFDLADEGKQIVIRRRNKRSYTLAPIDEDVDEEGDWYPSPEMEAKIERALAQAERKEGVVCKTYEDSLKFFDSL